MQTLIGMLKIVIKTYRSVCMQTLIGMLKIVIKTYNEQIAVAAQIVSVRVGDCGSFLEIWVCMGIAANVKEGRGRIWDR